jgi:hypothetical protein
LTSWAEKGGKEVAVGWIGRQKEKWFFILSFDFKFLNYEKGF